MVLGQKIQWATTAINEVAAQMKSGDFIIDKVEKLSSPDEVTLTIKLKRIGSCSASP